MTEELIRALLRDQHPDLVALPLRHAATGWDNQLWRLGDDLAVRLPYATERASDLLVKEHRWLPSLASLLPLPVPTRVRLGLPSERFPKHWTVVSWVPGTPADRAPVTLDSADALGAFLTALHREAPVDAPATTDRGVPLATFTPALPTPALRTIWADAIAAPAWSGPPVCLHGDLHPANVVTTDGPSPASSTSASSAAATPRRTSPPPGCSSRTRRASSPRTPRTTPRSGAPAAGLCCSRRGWCPSAKPAHPAGSRRGLSAAGPRWRGWRPEGHGPEEGVSCRTCGA